MNYRLRGNYSTEPEKALTELLKDRGVKDVDNFLHPSKKCELNPYLLDNIKEGAEMLLRHIRNNSKICLIIDSD